MKTKLAGRVFRSGQQVSPSTSGTLAAIAAALLLTLFVEVLAAQGIFGRISGTVTDSQRGAVAGAKVAIVNQDTRLERVVTTDTNGYYVASDLPVGVYSVSANRPGSRPSVAPETTWLPAPK